MSVGERLSVLIPFILVAFVLGFYVALRLVKP